jgi:hypothetical protein
MPDQRSVGRFDDRVEWVVFQLDGGEYMVNDDEEEGHSLYCH